MNYIRKHLNFQIFHYKHCTALLGVVALFSTLLPTNVLRNWIVITVSMTQVRV